jgi:hypothetical protein
MKGDVATLEWIRDRLGLGNADGRVIDDQLRYLEAAAQAKEFQAVAVASGRLRDALAGVKL